jgi:cytochrome c oxidase subunit 2
MVTSRLARLGLGSIALGSLIMLSMAAKAAGTGRPEAGQILLQQPVTPVGHEVHAFVNLVNMIIIAITVFVGALMAYVIIRFNERAHPAPTRTTHNTMLEVAWTVLPILILVVIAIPSFRLLYFQYSYPRPDLTIKAVGNAWFWEHEYPDQGGLRVTSNIVRDEDLLRAEVGKEEFDKRYGGLSGIPLLRRLKADADPLWQKRGEPRLLAVDNDIAVPVNKVVHVLVTANDVIHNWTIPSFGSKVDAVPGRITATWFKATQPGIYYGQCSELCGKDHAFMPIAVRVVSEQAFEDWVAAAKARDWRRAREILQAATAQQGGAALAEAAPARR